MDMPHAAVKELVHYPYNGYFRASLQHRSVAIRKTQRGDSITLGFQAAAGRRKCCGKTCRPHRSRLVVSVSVSPKHDKTTHFDLCLANCKLARNPVVSGLMCTIVHALYQRQSQPEDGFAMDRWLHLISIIFMGFSSYRPLHPHLGQR